MTKKLIIWKVILFLAKAISLSGTIFFGSLMIHKLKYLEFISDWLHQLYYDTSITVEQRKILEESVLAYQEMLEHGLPAWGVILLCLLCWTLLIFCSFPDFFKRKEDN